MANPESGTGHAEHIIILGLSLACSMVFQKSYTGTRFRAFQFSLTGGSSESLTVLCASGSKVPTIFKKNSHI